MTWVSCAHSTLDNFFLTLLMSFLTSSTVLSEPSDHEEDVVLPASPLLHIDDTEPNQIEAGPSPLQQQESHSSEAPQKGLKVNLTTAFVVNLHFLICHWLV